MIKICFAQRVNAFLKELLEQEIAVDGAIASTPEKVRQMRRRTRVFGRQSFTQFGISQRESFWSWRTKLPPAIVQTGPHSIHFDISMPIPKLYQVVHDTRAWMEKQGMIGRDIKAV